MGWFQKLREKVKKVNTVVNAGQMLDTKVVDTAEDILDKAAEATDSLASSMKALASTVKDLEKRLKALEGRKS